MRLALAGNLSGQSNCLDIVNIHNKCPSRKSLMLKNVGLGEKVTKFFLPTPKIS